MATVYNQALNAVSGGRTSAKLYISKSKYIFLNRSNGNLFLVYQERDARNLVQKCEQVKCATYMPGRGWIFTLTRPEYTQWVGRTGHKIQPAKSIYEKIDEWRKSPAGLAYQDLPDLTPGLMAELRAARMI